MVLKHYTKIVIQKLVIDISSCSSCIAEAILSCNLASSRALHKDSTKRTYGEKNGVPLGF